MITLLRTVRLAIRHALRQPGTTLVIVLTVAVGIGASTAIFTYLRDEYWFELPVPDADRLFFIDTGTRDVPTGKASYSDILLYRETLAELGDVAVWNIYGAVVGVPNEDDTGGETTYRLGLAVSPQYFDLLSVRFALGRGFLPEEDQPAGEPVVVVDYIFWSRYLGADPSAVGRTLRINGAPFTIVGVTPRGFQNTSLPMPIYIPPAHVDDILEQPVLADREARHFLGLLRLAEGVSPEAAKARLATVAHNLDRDHQGPGDSARFINLRSVQGSTENPGTGELMMVATVGLLLVLACTNVANLLLAHAAGRQREMAVHTAIGASRSTIIGRLLTENIILSIVGGALGLALGRSLTAFIQRLFEARPIGLGNLAEGVEWMQLDVRVYCFTLVVSVLAGCLFALAPILHTANTDLANSLKQTAGGKKPGRRVSARQLLVVVQVVLSTVLLLGAGLLIRSLLGLQQRDLGFETEHQLLVALSTAPPRMESPEQRRQVQRDLYEIGRQRLAELPGVEKVTLTSVVPGAGFVRKTRLALPELPDEDVDVDHITIGPDFFATYGIVMESGRPFNTGDRAGGMGAVIVNRIFARRFWDNDKPLGRVLRLPELRTDTADDPFVVVGVAPDIHHASRHDEPAPLIYLPIAQHLERSRVMVVARTTDAPRLLMHQAREAVVTAHPNLALVDLGTYDRQMAFDLHSERLYSSVMGLFSVLGLGLACLGLYSVVSCSVSYRLRELGVRMALGANPGDIIRLILREASVLLTAGVLIGVVAALALARLMTNLLHGVAPHDPKTFLALPLLLAAVGMAAAWWPAWRAGRVDPKVVLRAD